MGRHVLKLTWKINVSDTMIYVCHSSFNPLFLATQEDYTSQLLLVLGQGHMTRTGQWSVSRSDISHWVLHSVTHWNHLGKFKTYWYMNLNLLKFWFNWDWAQPEYLKKKLMFPWWFLGSAKFESWGKPFPVLVLKTILFYHTLLWWPQRQANPDTGSCQPENLSNV